MTALQADITATLAIQNAGTSVNVAYATKALVDQARDEASQEYLSVADAASNLAIDLGGITTATELLIISDQTISIKVNGTATALAGKVFLFSGAAITALTISNASGQAANVQIVMAG